MNRKLILTVAIILALVLTAGAYAYTYTTTALSINVASAGGDAVTFEPAPNQPEWMIILFNAIDDGDDKGDKDKKPTILGEVPHGDLFVIEPYPNFTGDVLVRIYLTNTEALDKAYRYLNMKLYIEDSVEAGGTPGFRLLTMENGVATFNIEGSVNNNYTVAVIGGSYLLNSNKPDKWEEGWSIAPEFYCEVIPK